GLSLDGRGRVVIFFLERTRDGIGEAEILKGGQKGDLSIIKGRSPALIGQERAKVSWRHPRVWGVGFGWLKGQARNRWTGSEHAARSDPVIPWVVGFIWNANAALSRLIALPFLTRLRNQRKSPPSPLFGGNRQVAMQKMAA